jgi:hypothetical protein
LNFVPVPASEDSSSTGQILRRAENGNVRDVVDKWLLQKRSQNQTISRPVLCEKALIFAQLSHTYIEMCVDVLFVRK